MSNTNTPRKTYKVTLEIDYEKLRELGYFVDDKPEHVRDSIIRSLDNPYTFNFIENRLITRAECVVEGGEDET